MKEWAKVDEALRKLKLAQEALIKKGGNDEDRRS
jgi:hypothetical protein